jgi:hypothetical protein
VQREKGDLGVYGIAIGGGVVCLSVFLVWIEVTSRSGASDRYRAIATFTGQTVFLAAILTVLAAIGIRASTSGWRFVFSSVAVLAALLLVGATAWAVIDPVGFVSYAARAQALATMTTSGQMHDASTALANAFSSGELEAAVRIGAVVGLVGGAIALAGALLSFAPRRQSIA